MRIGIAQINTRAGDLDATSDRMVALSRRAAAQGTDLLVFPMAAFTGPLPVGESEQDDFLVDVTEALVRMADDVACPCLVPVVGAVDGDPAPEAVLVADGRITPLKMSAYARAVSSGATEGEDAPAPDLPEFEFAGSRMGVAFTYDDLDDYDDFDFDLDVIVYASGYGYAADDAGTALGGALAENRFVDDARTTGSWIVGVGSLGGYGTSVYTGSSFVLSPSGELAAALPAFEEDLQVVDLEAGGPGRPAAPVVPEVYNRPLYLWQTLVLGVHDYLDKLGLRQAVVVLDGTVGSMALAAVTTDALGPTNVHAVVDVPGNVSREACCQRLARNLRVEVRDAGDMAPVAALSNPSDAVLRRGFLESYAAAWARTLGGVVLSSADKTSLALGGGQGLPVADALKPLGDVYRSDVLELMRMRNTISPVFPEVRLCPLDVPELGVDHAAYSDEAWVSAVDQILSDHIEYLRDATEVAAGAQETRLVGAVLSALDAAEPWRIGRGLYLMVSTTTLFDARRPIGLVWHDRDRSAEDESGEDAVERLVSHIAGPAALEGSQRQGKDPAEPAGKSPASGEDGRDDATRAREALSFLRDFAPGGAFRPKGFGERGQGDGKRPEGFGGFGNFEDSDGRSWSSPFSEN